MANNDNNTSHRLQIATQTASNNLRDQHNRRSMNARITEAQDNTHDIDVTDDALSPFPQTGTDKMTSSSLLPLSVDIECNSHKDLPTTNWETKQDDLSSSKTTPTVDKETIDPAKLVAGFQSLSPRKRLNATQKPIIHSLSLISEFLETNEAKLTRGDAGVDMAPLFQAVMILHELQKHTNVGTLSSIRLQKLGRRSHTLTLTEDLDDSEREVRSWLNQEYLTKPVEMSSSPSQIDEAARLKRCMKHIIVAGSIRKQLNSSCHNVTRFSVDEATTLFMYERTCQDAALSLYLKNASRWDMDIFELDIQTSGNALLVITMHLLDAHNTFINTGLSRLHMAEFLGHIQDGYSDKNPYHNRLHAADVVNSVAFFLHTKCLADKISPIQIAAAIVACAVHDYQHPGTNNQFQILSGSDLAMRYNDTSVLENFHCFESLNLLKNDTMNFMMDISNESRREMRTLIIDMVIGTDMAKHTEHVEKIEAYIAQSKSQMNVVVDDKNYVHTTLVSLVHCADIGNPCKPLVLSKQWTNRAIEEFYLQGDQERQLGWKISPLMNREQPNVPKSQLGFIDFVVSPLFKLLIEIMPDTMTLCSKALADTRNFWAQQEQFDIAAAAAAATPTATAAVTATTEATTATATKLLSADEAKGIMIDSDQYGKHVDYNTTNVK